MKIYLEDQVFNTSGALPVVGTTAPDFTVTGSDLTDIHLSDFSGKVVLLNIFPSIDTPTCACSINGFDQLAVKFPEVVILAISADLPFAQYQHCLAENIKNIKMGSVFREPEFGDLYGLRITEGPLRELLARAVILINTERKIVYAEFVERISNEPHYDAVSAHIEKIYALSRV